MSEDPTSRADRWDARYADPSNEWTYSPDSLVVELLGDLDPARALDVGCGTGGNALWLARRGWDVVGVDFASHAIEAARRGAADQGFEVEFLVVDITQTADVGRFDLVLVNYGLPSPDRGRVSALTFVDHALTPGGTLLMIDYAKPVAPPSDSAGVTSEELAAGFPEYQIVRSDVVRRGQQAVGRNGQRNQVELAPDHGWHPDLRDRATYNDPHLAVIFIARKPPRPRN